MSNRTLQIDDRLYAYLTEVSLREPQVLADLRAETATLEMASMQIAPEQGQFMAFLIRLMGAERCLEVGSFTGYSALVCALALPANGRLVALDSSREWTDIARRYWRAAGVDEKIELRLGPAADSLRELLDSGQRGSFDFMFIDADKTGYRTYFDLGLELLRPGGVMAFDNALWGGRVADPAISDDDTVAIREINRFLRDLSGVDLSLVPIGDGLNLIRKSNSS
jgi:predicted O-methyltransferase YrrM